MNSTPFKNLLLLLLITITASCNPLYHTVNNVKKSTPLQPDYSSSESWAVFPGNYPALLNEFEQVENDQKADVFYIYPTLFSDKKIKDWNADIWDASIRKDIFQKAVKYQVSAWLNAGDLYVPFYRQAHYRVFLEEPSDESKRAWELAYEDVKNAFEYYLENHNQWKPIIIACHSQGSMHAKRLIKDFFDRQALQSQLVAAYLIGTRIFPDEFESIKPMEKPNAVGGFVSWNAYKMKKFPKNYGEWFKGGVTTNPISWDSQKSSQMNHHKGILNEDLEIYPMSLRVEVKDGVLWTSVPKIPGRFYLSLIRNYHFADINLFWRDIEENAKVRVKAWYQKNSG